MLNKKYKIHYSLRNSGFTLIELLVVVGIAGVILGAGIAGYVRFNERQRVIQAANNLASALKQVQKRADVGEGAGECTSDDFEGYQVSRNGGVVNAQVMCGSTLTGGIVQVFTVPAGVTVENFGPFTFLSLSRGISSDNNIDIEIIGPPNRTVRVTPAGSVSVMD